jgi:hypothetical protein
MSPTTSNNILVYELLLVVVILDWELHVILGVTLDIGTYKPGSWTIVVQDAPLFDPGLQGSVACTNHPGLFGGGCFKWSRVILPHKILSKMNDMGIIRCIFLRRLQIW